MALLPCKECGKEISSKADKCPHCGAKVAKKTSGCAVLLVILLGVGAVVPVANSIFGQAALTPHPSPSSPSPTPMPPDKYEAWEIAKKFVLDNLKSPSTASFGEGVLSSQQNIDQAVTIQHQDGTYIVKLWVDSQNGFGGMMRTDFVLHMRFDSTDNTWSLVEPPLAVQRE